MDARRSYGSISRTGTAGLANPPWLSGSVRYLTNPARRAGQLPGRGFVK